ncbi:MAG TPA: hypothetical protein DHM44_05235 [Flexistipes sinusarabici]|uniref:Uncharacterized protein n=1 Tax=Flexistipes sinusarabici TaxID=2352 RepID=A0A3D5QB60_FLESI|nr:hypothetical protein [Flexistipes sinusarabici]
MNTQVLFYLIILTIFTYAINVPFGVARKKFRKFSLGWFLCIHAPIPVVAFIRISTQISFKLIPVLIIAAIAGQMTGSRVKRKNLS